MKNLIKILTVILLGLSLTGCELFDPREWAELKKDDTLTGRYYDTRTGETTIERPHCLLDSNGRKKECRKTPYHSQYYFFYYSFDYYRV